MLNGMKTLRNLLVRDDFEIVEDRVGMTGRELVVRSPEGRLVFLCAASESAYRDLQTLEAILYGEPEPGPIIGWTSPLRANVRGY
jgi:hypothetical protein